MDDITIMQPVRAKAKISAEERARRQAAINYARGSSRLEGFVVSHEFEQLNQRYVDGEISRAELTAAVLSRHNL